MNHYQIWHAIELFAHEHHMSCSGLAKYCGLNATTFNHSKRWSADGQPRWPSTRIISKIIESTGVTAKDFFKYITDDDTGPNHPDYKHPTR